MATRKQEKIRQKRLKLPGGEISQPQHSTVGFQKAVLQKIDQGEYSMGRTIDKKELTIFRINKMTKSITEEKLTVAGCLIPLFDIHTNLLHKHVELGLVRCKDFKPHTATDEELTQYLHKANAMTDSEIDRKQIKALALSCMTTRHLKIWHDHSEIAGHSHLIVFQWCTVQYSTTLKKSL